MIQATLDQLFPELLKLTANPLPVHQFVSLPYFTRFIGLLSQKECKAKADRSHKYFKLAKVARGTVIYGCDDLAQKGYILLSGAVRLLKKKSSREKTEQFAHQIQHTLQEKQNYLYNHFKIPKNKAEALTNLFYEQKMVFKYLEFHTLLNRQEFGFGEMVRNTSRGHTAVAIEQTQILVIDKVSFDESLRDFHQKKENSILARILGGIRSELVEEMMPKMMGIMNMGLLLRYDREDVVYTEEQFPSDLYFIVDGEVEVQKRTTLTVPKKYMKHEIKDKIQKQMIIRVCKTGKGAFFGEEEIFSGRKSRNFAIVTSLNNTIIFKIDHTSFIKAIADFPAYQKMIIENAVEKKSNSDQAFDKQYQKGLNAFLGQYQAYDTKKKEKMLSNIMKQSDKRTQLFEAFAPEGVFFRDTFQKLQGFDLAERSPQKSSIKRFKQRSTKLESTPGSIKAKENDAIIENQIAQKLLFSPKKSVNIAEFYADDLNQMTNQSVISPITPKKIQMKTIEQIQFKKQRSISKFQQIEKDEAIYKRVLIKNGLYPVEKKIDKSKSVKALVHHNFDQVIKQCVSRKNQSLKRTSKQKQDEIVMESFQRTVQSMRNKSFASTHSFKFSRFTTPCKGTQQLKKRMQSIHNLASGRLSDTSQLRKRPIAAKIQDCIGVNEKPKSSQISYRSKIGKLQSAHPLASRSPQKIILLNHMMKPIVYYNSTEL